jgi:hypothetical protein
VKSVTTVFSSRHIYIIGESGSRFITCLDDAPGAIVVLALSDDICLTVFILVEFKANVEHEG